MEHKNNNEQMPIDTTSAAIAANPMLPAVLFEQDDPSVCLKCVDYGTYYQLFSDGHYVNFKRFKKCMLLILQPVCGV